MAVSSSPSQGEPATAMNSGGFSCFLSNKMMEQIDAYHIATPGV